MNGKYAATVLALAIFLGLLGASALVSEAVLELRDRSRVVSVRGVAEREVIADLAIWPIKLRIAGNNLAEASAQAAAAKSKVVAFLRENGVPDEEISSQSVRVADRQANDYGQAEAGLRYMVESTVLVRSKNVETIRKVSQMTDRLVDAGVVLSSQGAWDATGPRFMFTQLNAVKPEMMAEATRNAREAANQFAADSGSAVGDIQKASQGLFTITDRDQAVSGQGGEAMPGISDLNKTVRVVVTIDYSLVK